MSPYVITQGDGIPGTWLRLHKIVMNTTGERGYVRNGRGHD